MEPMNEQKPLDEHTQTSSCDTHTAVASKVKTFSANNFREEIFRRSQDRAAKAMNRFTLVIAAATLINVLVAIWQTVRLGAH